MNNREEELSKEKIIKGINKKRTPEYAVLGQYVPVDKTFSAKNDPQKNKTNPVKNIEPPKFCIYDGDYIHSVNIDRKDIVKKNGKGFLNSLKIIFFNLPVISFFYLQIKHMKLKEFLSTLESINENTDIAANFFEGKMVLNEQKYKKICEELIKANNIHAQIEKNFID